MDFMATAATMYENRASGSETPTSTWPTSRTSTC